MTFGKKGKHGGARKGAGRRAVQSISQEIATSQETLVTLENLHNKILRSRDTLIGSLCTVLNMSARELQELVEDAPHMFPDDFHELGAAYVRVQSKIREARLQLPQAQRTALLSMTKIAQNI